MRYSRRLMLVLALFALTPTLSYAHCEKPEDCCVFVGDHIIDRAGYWGRVLHAYDNGVVSVWFDDEGIGHEEQRNARDVWREVPESAGLHAGDRVVDAVGYTGKVIRAYANGQVSIWFDDASYGHRENREARTVSAEVRERDGFHVGDRIQTVDANHFTGSVKRLYANGLVLVRFDDGGGGHDEMRWAKEITAGPHEVNGLCAHDCDFDHRVHAMNNQLDLGQSRSDEDAREAKNVVIIGGSGNGGGEPVVKAVVGQAQEAG